MPRKCCCCCCCCPAIKGCLALPWVTKFLGCNVGCCAWLGSVAICPNSTLTLGNFCCFATWILDVVPNLASQTLIWIRCLCYIVALAFWSGGLAIVHRAYSSHCPADPSKFLLHNACHQLPKTLLHTGLALPLACATFHFGVFLRSVGIASKDELTSDGPVLIKHGFFRDQVIPLLSLYANVCVVLATPQWPWADIRAAYMLIPGAILMETAICLKVSSRLAFSLAALVAAHSVTLANTDPANGFQLNHLWGLATCVVILVLSGFVDRRLHDFRASQLANPARKGFKCSNFSCSCVWGDRSTSRNGDYHA